MTANSADIGLIGLAVMGENLVLNMESHGFTVAVFNRTVARVEEFLAGRARGKKIIGCRCVKELVAALKRPRKVMMMVKAGPAVDQVIAEVAPLLEPGDILIDGGNTHYPDTTRRLHELREKGLLYIGTGVSGGEEGALRGPSIMPGGDPGAWPHVKPIFQAIAAKAPDGSPCCDWVGAEGAGHYVKMVHNGIEYGDMQLIGEAYHLLSGLAGLDAAVLHEVFGRWNKGKLDSYLIEITRDIFDYRDPESGKPLVDLILDAAGQKGTGKWMVGSATDLGVPLTLITEAVFARCLSAQKEERIAAAAILHGPPSPHPNPPPQGGREHNTPHPNPPPQGGREHNTPHPVVGEGWSGGGREAFINDVEMALYASKIISYAQGFALLNLMSRESGWTINNGAVALMWRGGCIIRSVFLGKIKEAFDRNPKLSNLLVDPYFAAEIERAQAGWRRAVVAGIAGGIPLPAISAALAYYDGYRSGRLPANLLQAQRDYFGAHTYERVDKPRGQFFHTNWTGRGGTTASSTYNV